MDLGRVAVSIHGIVDRHAGVRKELTVFNRVRIRFDVAAVTAEQAESLVERVGRRCPLYGSVPTSAAALEVEVNAVALASG